MTLGTGIFASVVLALFVVGLWQATKHRKWKTIGKVFAVLFALGALLALGLWGWIKYSERPKIQKSLDGITLGMTPLEVQILKGKPEGDRAEASDDGDKELRWLLKSDNDYRTFVLFTPGSDKDQEQLRASIVCQYGGYPNLMGITRFASEASIVERLGNPTHTSIRGDGLAKLISYEPWQVAFEIERGTVSAMCVANSGKVSFQEEYSEGDNESVPARAED